MGAPLIAVLALAAVDAEKTDAEKRMPKKPSVQSDRGLFSLKSLS